jgi:hypothetical protein
MVGCILRLITFGPLVALVDSGMVDHVDHVDHQPVGWAIRVPERADPVPHGEPAAHHPPGRRLLRRPDRRPAGGDRRHRRPAGQRLARQRRGRPGGGRATSRRRTGSSPAPPRSTCSIRWICGSPARSSRPAPAPARPRRAAPAPTRRPWCWWWGWGRVVAAAGPVDGPPADAIGAQGAGGGRHRAARRGRAAAAGRSPWRT